MNISLLPQDCTCVLYDEEGSFRFINEYIPYDGVQRCFRKYTTSVLEKTICNELLKNPHRNIVTIYAVKGNIIDQELLESCIYHKEKIPNMINDIRDGLEHLHKNKIVYIDLKLDNIGYSTKEGCFKLFDFDMSGIAHPNDSSKWLHEPDIGFAYKKYMKSHGNVLTNVFAMDTYNLSRFPC